MSDLMDDVNATRPTGGFISYADDFVTCTKEVDANDVWKKAVETLKSNFARHHSTGWQHENLKFTDSLAAFGKGATELDES